MRLGFGRKKRAQPAAQTTASTDSAESAASWPRLVVSAVSLLGGRATQQDTLDYRLLSNGAFAAAVCDGMGGLRGGETASRTACAGFFRACEQARAGAVPDFKNIVRQLDRQVAALKGPDGQSLDGGSTLVGIWLRQDRLSWIAVGDSRIGLVRDGRLSWLNRLHNYQMELDQALRAGELSREEYCAELPRGRALLSYLGCGGLRYVDGGNLPWMLGDRLILCSDGFCELLPREKLLRLLMDLGSGVSDLSRAVLPYLEAKGETADNATAIVIQYQ